MKDTQNLDVNGRKIEKVGVRELYGEVIFNSKILPGNFSLYVSLKNKKGIHMSRLPQVVLEHSPLLIDKHNLQNILDVTEIRSGDFCEDYYVKVSFDYAREILSPVTKLKNIMLIPIKIKSEKKNDNTYTHHLTITTPYTSLCPCSKEISEYSAHNQRSTAEITVEVGECDIFDLTTQLISIVEEAASCPIYNILKREDEKYVTEKAYDNPKFVEDMTRELSESLTKLLQQNLILDYSTVVNHYESIHTHNVVGITYAGRKLK